MTTLRSTNDRIRQAEAEHKLKFAIFPFWFVECVVYDAIWDATVETQ